MRRRPSVYYAMGAIADRREIFSVLVESDIKSYFSNVPVAKYIFDNKYEFWNKPRLLNLGIQHLLKHSSVDRILMHDADIIMSPEAIQNILNYKGTEAIVMPSIKNYEKSLGFCLIKREVFETIGGYDEDLFGWGYEDDNFLIRARMRKFDVSGPIYPGEIRHMRDRMRPSLRAPGMKKWNTWEYNRIITDYKIGLDPYFGPSMGYLEMRGKFPKVWQDSSEVEV